MKTVCICAQCGKQEDAVYYFWHAPDPRLPEGWITLSVRLPLHPATSDQPTAMTQVWESVEVCSGPCAVAKINSWEQVPEPVG